MSILLKTQIWNKGTWYAASFFHASNWQGTMVELLVASLHLLKEQNFFIFYELWITQGSFIFFYKYINI